ncbi:H-NS histone family protein [Roseobacter sinensis]|uniref:H-NS histone family protein n=1 Tax=Roseobacter sinensis TaxID=2931391 RepID=A0ABT3BL30_9RHOB|nr:H-NS histone family protein [Roseobacter sp. WL0113]MCV3274282.1 H-NS histone family protein [Roseobacter sp. WL0113]
MAIDVSKMSRSELDKLSAKIEERRKELARHDALTQMTAVAKKYGVDFEEVARLHSAKLPKTTKKVARKTAPKAVAKTTPKPKTKAKSKPAEKPKSVAVKTAAAKPAAKPKVVSKAKYKNPDNPKQTWSGMGRKPAWLIAHLDAGKKLEGLAA